jgi:hypothetical protein
MAITTKIAVSLNMTSCSLIFLNVSEESVASIARYKFKIEEAYSFEILVGICQTKNGVKF